MFLWFRRDVPYPNRTTVTGGGRSWQPGFTIIELMVTLAVAAILAIIALPGLKTLLYNYRQDAVVDALFNNLSVARNTALSNDQPITVCPLGTASGCGTDWSKGWIVLDQPAVGPATVLATTDLGDSGPRLSAQGGSTVIVFNGRGLAAGSDLFVICDQRGSAHARAVIVNPVGFIQISPQSGQAPDGSGLTCS